MNKTKKSCEDISNMITINQEMLASKLGCGKSTAIKIGKESGAEIRIGRRCLYSVNKLQEYLDSLSD